MKSIFAFIVGSIVGVFTTIFVLAKQATSTEKKPGGKPTRTSAPKSARKSKKEKAKQKILDLLQQQALPRFSRHSRLRSEGERPDVSDLPHDDTLIRCRAANARVRGTKPGGRACTPQRSSRGVPDQRRVEERPLVSWAARPARCSAESPPWDRPCAAAPA